MIVNRQKRRWHTDVAGTEVNGLLRGISLLHLEGLCGIEGEGLAKRNGKLDNQSFGQDVLVTSSVVL